MLILTRRPVESIYIGEEVTVTVLGVVGNQVRFGIEAPRHIVIDRAEIHERKKRAALGDGAHDSSGPQGTGRSQGHPATASADMNGNVLDGEKAISAGEEDRQSVNGNVATLKLRR